MKKVLLLFSVFFFSKVSFASFSELHQLKARDFATKMFVSKMKFSDSFYKIEKIESINSTFPTGDESLKIVISYIEQSNTAEMSYVVECGHYEDLSNIFCMVLIP